jgi:hypothetical protein
VAAQSGGLSSSAQLHGGSLRRHMHSNVIDKWEPCNVKPLRLLAYTQTYIHK